MFNYGARNGVSTVIKFVKALCKIYLTYQERIIAYINGSTLSAGDKAAVIAWLNLASSSCAILVSIEYNYE